MKVLFIADGRIRRARHVREISDTMSMQAGSLGGFDLCVHVFSQYPYLFLNDDPEFGAARLTIISGDGEQSSDKSFLEISKRELVGDYSNVMTEMFWEFNMRLSSFLQFTAPKLAV